MHAKYKFEIYGDILSQPVRSVLLFCDMNNISYEFIKIDLGKGENYSEDYKKINPLSKIPAIVLQSGDKIFKMSESCSILRFLSDYFKVDESFYPRNDLFRRALVDQWLDWNHLNTRLIIANCVFNKLFLPVLKKIGIQKDTIDTDKMLPRLLSFINKKFSTSKTKYFVDDEITIADLIIACELFQLKMIDYDLKQYPHLVEYLNRVNSFESIRKLNTKVDQIMEKIKSKMSKAKF